MNRGIDKTQKQLEDINQKIDEFNHQMKFREVSWEAISMRMGNVMIMNVDDKKYKMEYTRNWCVDCMSYIKTDGTCNCRCYRNQKV